MHSPLGFKVIFPVLGLLVLNYSFFAHIVREFLEYKGIDLNALNKLKETTLDVVEKSHFMEVAPKIKSALKEAGAENEKHISQPKEGREIKQTVSDIKHDVHTQLVQIEKK